MRRSSATATTARSRRSISSETTCVGRSPGLRGSERSRSRPASRSPSAGTGSCVATSTKPARCSSTRLRKRSPQNRALRAAARAHGGAIVFRLGDLETARLWWEEALALYRDLGDVDGISRCIAELGGVAMASGQLDEAAARYLESAAIFEEVGNDVRLAVALSNLGGIEGLRGNHEEAAAYTERALALQRSDRRPRRRGRVAGQPRPHAHFARAACAGLASSRVKACS